MAEGPAPALIGAAPRQRGAAIWPWLLVLAIAVAVAYANSLGGEFVFDDLAAIRDNPTIRSLGTALFPPAASWITVSGRPVLNFSFALNHLLSGDAVWSYHATNVAIHLGAALALFGVVRRAVVGAAGRGLARGLPAERFAGGVALLWAVHPLGTESVTYTVQRAESLAGLFLLLTLYGVARAAESARPGRWTAAAVGCCLLGMGTKEVMVAAPLLALLYDRTFFAGSFAAAWRARRGLHLALAATWALLAVLVVQSGDRGGSAGFGTLVTPWEYLRTQAEAIPLYLRLAFWPRGLTLDRGVPDIPAFGAVALPMVLLGGALVASVWAVWRRPAAGFVGLWFFALLAPSSSIVPVASQTIAEHRMYLPLVAPLVLVVFALWRAGPGGARIAVPVLAVAAAVTTADRNRDYRTALALWRDTAAKAPANPRAVGSLGWALFEAGEPAAGEAELRRAVGMLPTDVPLRMLLGRLLERSARPAEAAEQYAAAAQLEPELPEARGQLGNVLLELGRTEAALVELVAARRLQPESPDIAYNLAGALLRAGRPAEALPLLEEVVRRDPAASDARGRLAAVLLELGRIDEAERVLAALPPEASARGETVLLQARVAHARGRGDEARRGYREALRLAPQLVEARIGLGALALRAGDDEEAATQLAAVVAAGRATPAVYNNLGIALARSGRVEEALGHFREAVRLDPNFGDARENLSRLEAALGGARS